MRIAVCSADENERRRICAAIEAAAAAVRSAAFPAVFRSEEALWREFVPGRFQGAVVGFGDLTGFLCARRIREEDSTCRVVLLDDTEKYAIRGLRIHLSDFLLRPIEDERLRAAMERLLT